jgi:hypothetical protein
VGTERLVDPAEQIKGPITFWKFYRICGHPFCREAATWVSHNGRFIHCDEHAPFEEEW